MELLIASLKKIKNKFKYAFKGLWHGITRDCSIQIQVFIAVFVIIFFLFLKISLHDWLWVCSSIFLVIICEFINSCLEKMCDLICSEQSKSIEIIKDMGSAFVLLAATYSIIVAGILIVQYL